MPPKEGDPMEGTGGAVGNTAGILDGILVIWTTVAVVGEEVLLLVIGALVNGVYETPSSSS